MIKNPIEQILKVAAVLGILVLIIHFNPFGIWKKEYLSLKDTPNMIKEIKRMGQLNSAKFYGEVIRSYTDAMSSNPEQVAYNTIRKKVDSIFSKHQSRQDRKDNMLKFLEAKENTNYKKNFDEWKKKMGKRSLYRFIKKIEEKSWSEFLPLINRKNSEFSKIRLAYIGRGVVKAGLDLREFDNPLYSIKLQRFADTLYIRNLDPRILTADINPWFYKTSKKEGIKGYEVILGGENAVELKGKTTENKVALKQVNQVKKECRMGLIEEAYERDILESAITSAERSLGLFFNALNEPGESPLAAVRIIPSSNYCFKKGLLADSRIDSLETKLMLARFGAEGENLKELLTDFVENDSLANPSNWILMQGLNQVSLGIDEPESWAKVQEIFREKEAAILTAARKSAEIQIEQLDKSPFEEDVVAEQRYCYGF